MLEFVSCLLTDMKALMMNVDMLEWAIDNPAPANYFLISNDAELAYTINHLLSRDHNILLALSEEKVYSIPLVVNQRVYSFALVSLLEDLQYLWENCCD